MNLKIEQTKQTLINTLNNSELPIGVALLIIKDILNDLNISYNQIITNEYNKQQQMFSMSPEETSEEILLTEEEEDIDG